jgi:hypothetical protein
MSRKGLYGSSENRNGSSVSPGTDAEIVASLHDTPFQGGIPAIRMRLAERTQQGPLGSQRSGFKVPPHADSQHQRRAGVGPRQGYGLHNLFEHPLLTVRRAQHVDAAHIFASHSLGGHGNAELIPGNPAIVNNGGSVVSGIFSIEKRIPHHGFAKKTFDVGPPHPLVKGLFKAPSIQARILSQIHEKHYHAAILAERNPFPPGDIPIVQEILKNCDSQGRTLSFPPVFQGGNHIPGKLEGRFQRERIHRIPYLGNMNGTHGITFFL